MEDPGDKAASLNLHPEAKKLIRERSSGFATILTAQAKMLAHFQGHDVVLKKHVQEAWDIFTRGRKPRSIVSEMCVAVGGAMFGVGISDFVGELTREQGIRATPITAFTALFVAGLCLIIVQTKPRP